MDMTRWAHEIACYAVRIESVCNGFSADRVQDNILVLVNRSDLILRGIELRGKLIP